MADDDGTCWECDRGPLVLAEAHPEYPIYFCFGCGTHSTVDLVALRAWSAR